MSNFIQTSKQCHGGRCGTAYPWWRQQGQDVAALPHVSDRCISGARHNEGKAERREQHGGTVTAPPPVALDPLPLLAAPSTCWLAAVHNELQSTVTNLFSSLDLNQASPFLLGTPTKVTGLYVGMPLLALHYIKINKNLEWGKILVSKL